MPRIISDKLFDSLMRCVKDQRLLGVMGKLEQMYEESKYVIQQQSLFIPLEGGIGEYQVYLGKGEFNFGPTTDNN